MTSLRTGTNKLRRERKKVNVSAEVVIIASGRYHLSVLSPEDRWAALMDPQGTRSDTRKINEALKSYIRKAMKLRTSISYRLMLAFTERQPLYIPIPQIRLMLLRAFSKILVLNSLKLRPSSSSAPRYL